MDRRAHGIHNHIFTLLDVANAIRALTGRPSDPQAYGAWEIGASDDLATLDLSAANCTA